jgi:hypothetical protein
LSGSVNPNGLSTNASFQWGPTTAYGNVTPPQSIGNVTQTVAATLSGLSANTSYHARITATNSAGTVNGNDVTFTTSGLAPVPDFTIQVSPGAQSVTQGNPVNFSVSVQSQNSFGSPVSLTAFNVLGSQASFSPSAVTPLANGSATSNLTIATSLSTPIGTSTLTIQGQSGSLTRNATASLTVNAQVLSPTLSVLPASGTQLTNFTVTGTNYTPSGTINRFVQIPGQSWQQISSITATSAGAITTQWPFQPGCTYPAGTAQAYAVDASTNRQSPTVTEQVFADSSCPLTITSISPNSIIKGQSYTFTLTGNGFQQGFTATLINEANQSFPITITQFISATSIQVTASIGSGPTATQTIRITNPSGQSASIPFTALGNCPGKFCLGDVVTVYNTLGAGLNLRTCASTSCSIVLNMSDGTTMTVFGGPVSSDGYTWWGIQGVIGGVTRTGWAADQWLRK